MKLVPLKPITLLTSNLTADTTPLWDIEAGYNTDTIRKYNDKLYQALGSIDPLAQYIYDNSDVLNQHYTITILTGLSVVNTAVPCDQNITVVYSKDENKYYLYIGATANVNLSTTTLSSSGSFSEVTAYRHETYSPDTTVLKWADNGFVNEKKMLDSSLGSQTEHTGNMVFTFVASRIDTLAFMNMDGVLSIDLKITNQATLEVLVDENYATQTRVAYSWYEYFFDPFASRKNIVIDVPIGTGFLFEIVVNGALPKIGLFGTGRSEFLGGTSYGVKVSATDYSKKLTNSSGEYYIEEGRFSRTNDLSVSVETSFVDIVVERLDALRATPIIFNGSDDFSSMKIFGIYNSYDVIVNLPTKSVLNIQLESLT